MNEEEKNIKMFKRYINSLEQRLEDYYRIDEEFYKDNIEDLELNIKLAKYILSLISKLQKELDKKDICLKTCEDDLIKERQLRIKQDKVIDLMAQERAEICETRVSKEAIIDFYFKKVEEENENR